MIKYYYDSSGNFTGYSFHNSIGSLVDFFYYFSYVTYKYDKKNRLIEVAWFDKDSNLLDDSRHMKIIFEYKNKNKISEIKFYTAENTLGYGTIDTDLRNSYKKGYLSQDSYNNFSRKVYKYNKFGKIILEEYYDRYSKLLRYSKYNYVLGIYKNGKIVEGLPR